MDFLVIKVSKPLLFFHFIFIRRLARPSFGRLVGPNDDLGGFGGDSPFAPLPPSGSASGIRCINLQHNTHQHTIPVSFRVASQLTLSGQNCRVIIEAVQLSETTARPTIRYLSSVNKQSDPVTGGKMDGQPTYTERADITQ